MHTIAVRQVRRVIKVNSVGRRGPQGPKGDPGDATNAPVQSVNAKIGTVVINKSDIGLPNVDNTSDANKPVSTAVQTALAQKLNKGVYFINLADYTGAVGDGEHNDSAAFVAATIDALASGFKLYVPTPDVSWRIDDCWEIPYTVLNTRLKQRPLTIVGDGPAWDGTWLSDPINGGSVIDLRYDNTDGTDGERAAKMVTRGAGYLEITGITFKSGGTDNFPFIQTTNTSLFIHHCAFIGNMAGYQGTCEQDAIILGGTNNGENSSDWQAGFQGYGGILDTNYYSHIRSNVWQTYANAFETRNETWSTSCGSNRAHPAPYHVEPMAGFGASGNKWYGGTVEMTGYKHGVCLMNDSQANVIDNIGLYDDGNQAVSYVYCGASNTSFNEIRVGLFNYSCPAASGPSAKEQLIVDARAQDSYFPYGVNTKTLSFSNGIGEPVTAQIKDGGRTLTSVTEDTPDGGPIVIDTGPGGSLLPITAYAVHLKDHQGNLRIRLLLGQSGAVGLGTTTTGGRPAASAVGAGAILYDTTLGRLIESDGTNWKVSALDSAVVHLNGNETINDVKTFTSNPVISSGLPGISIHTTQGDAKTYSYFASYDSADTLSFVEQVGASVVQRIIISANQFNYTQSDILISDTNRGVILTAPDGGHWRLTVNNLGAVSSESV